MSSMNLLPDSYIKQQFRDRTDLVCILIFAVIMSGAIFVDRVTRTSFDKARGRYVNATLMSARASGLTGEFFALQRTKDEMITEAKDAMKMEECIPRSYLLGVIANSLPKTVSLTKVQLRTQIPIIGNENLPTTAAKKDNVQRKSSTGQPTIDTPPEPKPKPVVTVTLEGVSVSENDYDVADFIRILKEKQLSKKVTLLYARQQKSRKPGISGEEKRQKLREFGICMELLNDVDVRELIKSDSRKITLPPLVESGNTGIEMGNSPVEGAAK